MNGPKFRFTVIIGIILITWWAWEVTTTYLLGTVGLNFNQYVRGVLQLGLSTAFGLLLIWLAVFLTKASQKKLRTGFEAEVEDEYGTIFKMGISNKSPFPMKLPKFLPDIIGAPIPDNISTLEADLIGFLNGYRRWPIELNKNEESLHSRAIRRWFIIKNFPGANMWHGAIALAADLNKICAYKEIRRPLPFSKIFDKDKIRFESRAIAHGGLSAFILSTLPSFRSIANNPELSDERSSLLAALRYIDDPRMLPVNIPAFAKELLDYWQRAETALLPSDEDPSFIRDSAIIDFQLFIAHVLEEALKNMSYSSVPNNECDGLILPNKTILVKPSSLLQSLGQEIPTSLKLKVKLWDGSNSTHPIWPHIVNYLKKIELWSDNFNGLIQSEKGWMFKSDLGNFGPAIVINLANEPALQHILADLPVCDAKMTPEITTEEVRQVVMNKAIEAGEVLKYQF